MHERLNINTVENFKNLYINGCSFTAGHSLKKNDQFPFKLNELLGTELFNFSKNGNSLETIAFTSIHHLQDFDPEDTLVVIGLTWSSRFGILLNERMFNLTPADIRKGKAKTSFTDKNTYPRFSVPYVNVRNINIEEVQVENQESVDEVLKQYRKYIETLITYDDNVNSNFLGKYIYTLVNLENYLKLRKFNYLFIDYSGEAKFCRENYKLGSLLDQTRIVSMYKGLYNEFTIDPNTSHPTAEATTFLAEHIANIFNLNKVYE